MGSMNFNWLSYPLSPSAHSSLPTNLDEASQSHHFALGLYNEPMQPCLEEQDWISNNSVGDQEVKFLKAADFLGVGNSETTPTEISTFNQFQPTQSEYQYLPNFTLASAENAIVDANISNETAESSQCLALTMGNDSNNLNAENSTTAIVLAPRRTLDTFGQRTSIYRGVTKHRWTGRYEAHLWDNTSRREGQSRKGRQVYLGGYDKEEKAARAYDLAALKYWGTSTTTNFPLTNYEREIEEMKHMTRQEFIASLRRRSSGFSRGASMYRGVTRHHQHGRWQARIGRVSGNKDLYLGTFSTEEEAAEAYDVAAIKFRGLSAVTNFDMNRYNVKSILESNLPLGNSKRFKESHAIELARKREDMQVLAATSCFYDGSSSSSFQGYPSMTQIEQVQPEPLLSLQHHSNPYYTQNTTSHPTFIPMQQTAMALFQPNQDNSQYHHNYLHSHPHVLQGYITSNMNSSMMGSNGVLMAVANSSTSGSGIADEGVTNYETSSVSYGGWSADSVHGTNPGVYPMWGSNDN